MTGARKYVSHYLGPRKQDYCTPRPFFDKLNAKYTFTLDGAASEENALLPNFSSSDNPRSWAIHRVFCNPPWSNIPPFIELAATAPFACLLVPARVNAKWFHRALALGAEVRYFCGKLSFGGSWNSPTDCLLLIWSGKQEGSDERQ